MSMNFKSIATVLCVITALILAVRRLLFTITFEPRNEFEQYCHLVLLHPIS